MNCCHGECRDLPFDAKRAAKDLRRYRRRGPDKTTRLLLDALRAEDVRGAALLDVGGGVGAVHHELLAAGAQSAVQVDAAAPYLRAAEAEAERRGHAGRVTFRHGDFVAVAAEVPPADVVTLDRVICCYRDMEGLVAASASRARRLYGAVFPRDTRLARAVVAVANLAWRVRGSAFRTYLHPPGAIDAAVRRQGLGLRTVRDTIMWRVAVYAR